MARRKRHEEHLNHEAWAIPYGDLITLLLAFFVVMYAISSVNEGKYRALSESLSAVFHGPPKRMRPVEMGHQPKGTSNGPPIITMTPNPIDMSPTTSEGEVPVAGEDSPALQRSAGDGQDGGIKKMADEVEKAMATLIKKHLITVRRSDLWIEIEIKTDILFPSGVANVAPAAKPVLTKLAGILSPFPNPIRVEGHTDSVPIHTARFHSNWELSAARAANVVEQFQSQGVDPDRMAVVGFGKYRPAAPNDNAADRNKNRRVLIVVMAAPRAHQTVPAPSAIDHLQTAGSGSRLSLVSPPAPTARAAGAEQNPEETRIAGTK